jgi:NAD(P)-dependent dehydrogenase (short-subunit alcohol dehydrogenase family)
MNILILGASRGIGHEFVRQYREAGATVIATARTEEALQQLRDLGARAIKLDVTDPASISGLGWQLDGEKLDVAIYVAGVYTTAGATQPPSRDEFDRTMHTNVLGAMQAIPQVAPLVEAAGGKFVFITSQMGKIGGVGSSFGWVYRVSKAALNMAVASAQPDYPKAIFVAMSPGWVQTDMGGAGAPLKVQDSVAGMRAAISRLTRRGPAAFLDHDGRRFDSW